MDAYQIMREAAEHAQKMMNDASHGDLIVDIRLMTESFHIRAWSGKTHDWNVLVPYVLVEEFNGNLLLLKIDEAVEHWHKINAKGA